MAKPIEVGLSPYWPVAIQQWTPLIIKWASNYSIDPNLLAAIMLQESGGNSDIVSASGACGLMQVMARDTTSGYGVMFYSRPTCAELKDPDTNVGWATDYLVWLYQTSGNDWREALYRYGPSNIGYNYADRILQLYRQSRDVISQ